MSKIYLLSHSQHRFDTDFFCVYAHLKRKECPQCGVNLAPTLPPLLYYWDEEFGNPSKSWEQRHVCFWGSFRLLVTEPGKAVLEQLRLPLLFEHSQLVETDIVDDEVVIETVEDSKPTLYWTRPTIHLSVDLASNPHQICTACGRFIDPARQLTRLKVPEREVISSGLFAIQQNASEPIFVSEGVKDALANANLRGLGFYPAGRTV